MTSILKSCVGNSSKLLFALLIVFLANVVDVSYAEAGSYLATPGYEVTTYSGFQWLTMIAPFPGTGTYNPSVIYYNDATSTAQGYTAMGNFINGVGSISYSYPQGTRVVSNGGLHYTSIPNGTYTYVYCEAVVLGDWCGWDLSTYPTREEALALSDVVYVEWTKSASGISVAGVPTFKSTYNTRFTDISITGTSSVNISVDYILDQSEIITTNSAYNPSQVNFGIALRPTTAISARGVEIDETVQGSGSTDYTFTGLVDGVYDVNITFYNAGVLFGQDRPFKDSYIYSSFTVASGTLTATGTPEYYDNVEALPVTQKAPCGTTEIGGCIQNAFSYLFIPSDSGMKQITGLYATLSTKFPFAYFTDFNDSITSVFTHPTTESLAISVPFGTFGTLDLISEEMIEAVPFTALIRSLLGAIIWLMMAYTIYRRTLRIFNPETA